MNPTALDFDQLGRVQTPPGRFDTNSNMAHAGSTMLILQNAFDKINHKALLEKLNTTPIIQRQVQAWLEAGIFEKGDAFPCTGIGTPQGGVISPLLANIALDGGQHAIWEAVYKYSRNKKKADKVLYIRYADDFVILSPEKEWLDVAISAITTHLSSTWV